MSKDSIEMHTVLIKSYFFGFIVWRFRDISLEEIMKNVLLDGAKIFLHGHCQKYSNLLNQKPLLSIIFSQLKAN